MTIEEFQPTVETWAEILVNDIPEDELMLCYTSAIKFPDRRTGFPIGVSEILEAHRRIAAARPTPNKKCDFCRMHEAEPDVYPRCGFHPAEIKPSSDYDFGDYTGSRVEIVGK